MASDAAALDTVWLLDVDGVVNAVAARPDRSLWPLEEWLRTSARSGGLEYPIMAARPVLTFLRDVAESRLADIRWHTTWQHDAVKELAPALSLPRFPIEPAPEFDAVGTPSGYAGTYTQPSWWKLPAALRVLDGSARIVWTDDDLATSVVRHEMADNSFPPERALLIAPRTNVGLTPRHLRTISSFLRRTD